MDNKLTPEQMEQAKACKSVEDLLTLAKDNGIEITEAEAEKLDPENTELADSELESVSGGGCGSDDREETKTKSQRGSVIHR